MYQVHESVSKTAQALLDAKTKPKGSLGQLEQWAVRCVPFSLKRDKKNRKPFISMHWQLG